MTTEGLGPETSAHRVFRLAWEKPTRSTTTSSDGGHFAVLHRARDGVAANVLAAIGVSNERTRTQDDETVRWTGFGRCHFHRSTCGAGRASRGLEVSPGVRRARERSLGEAGEMGHNRLWMTGARVEAAALPVAYTLGRHGERKRW